MNNLESAIAAKLRRRGYLVFRKGWPDFLVMSGDGRFGFGLEVKDNADRLSNAQIQMHRALAACGIFTRTCYRSFLDEMDANGFGQLFMCNRIKDIRTSIQNHSAYLSFLQQSIIDHRKVLDETLHILQPGHLVCDESLGLPNEIDQIEKAE